MDIIVDVWHIIFKHTTKWRDVLEIRRVNTCANKAFFDIVETCTEYSHCQRTFIKTNTCMFCEQYTKNIHQIVYNNDSYPMRRLYFCDSFKCFVATLKCYIKDMIYDNVYPFVYINPRNIRISRTNGGYSIGKVIGSTMKYHKEEWYISVQFDETIHYNDCLEKDIEDEKEFTLKKLVKIASLPDDVIHAHNLFCPLFNHIQIHDIHQNENHSPPDYKSLSQKPWVFSCAAMSYPY